MRLLLSSKVLFGNFFGQQLPQLHEITLMAMVDRILGRNHRGNPSDSRFRVAVKPAGERERERHVA